MKKIFLIILIAFSCLSSVTLAQQVVVGQGTGLSIFSPLCRTKDYSVYEIIYLSSDIGVSGIIKNIAFYRADGSNTDPFDSVSIYMKHTSDSLLLASNYSEAGYTLVYSGTFPNDSGAGWRDVALDNPFAYDGINNLMVLTVKKYQPAVANTPVAPRWYYTNISPASDRARRYYDNNPINSSTALTTINFSANARLDFGSVGIREIGNSSIEIFPNPADNKFTVSLFSPERNAKLFLYDYQGRIAYQSELTSAHGQVSEEIDVENLKTGIYLVIIESGNKKYSAKVLVE
jgi:hypothetical protein